MAGYYKGLTLSELQDLILWNIGQISGTSGVYTRFTKAYIRQLINERQVEFVERTHCLRKQAIIREKDGLRQYKLPSICIDNGVIGVKHYLTSTNYEELEIKDQDYMDTTHQGYLTDSDSDPYWCWQGPSVGNRGTINVYPTPSTDGSNYISSMDTGIYYGTDLPVAMNSISATCTDGSATSVTDSGEDFTKDGLVEGLYVLNVTDGSYGYITTIAAETLTISSLTGGTDNTFTAGDVYTILAGEYIVYINWEDDTEKYLFGYRPGILSTITVPADHIYIDFVPYPAHFPDADCDDVYPEIPKKYHKALADGVVSNLLESFHEKSKEFNRAAYYEARFQAAVAECSTKKSSRPFQVKPSAMRPTMRRIR